MPNYSRNDVVLVAYPFSDRTGSKVRPAVIVSGSHRSQDLFVVPLTSRANRMVEGEFSLADWRSVGLNMASVVKRGLFTVHESFILKRVGTLGRWTQAESTSRFDRGSCCDRQRRIEIRNFLQLRDR
jgi:mRNA interferase MazF